MPGDVAVGHCSERYWDEKRMREEARWLNRPSGKRRFARSGTDAMLSIVDSQIQ